MAPLFTAGAVDPTDELLERSAFNAEERRVLRDVLDAARSVDIPVDFFVPRLQEGIAKGVDARRIARALETDLDNLVRAREVARAVSGGEYLVADHARWGRAATILAAGRPREELRVLVEISARHPDRFRPAGALHVSLIDWGVSPADALRIVRAAVASPLSPDTYPGIAELFAVARRERIRPDRMADRVVDGLKRAESIGTLRAIVVE